MKTERVLNLIVIGLFLFVIVLAALTFNRRKGIDLSIYTQYDIYHIDVGRNRVISESGNIDKLFDSMEELNDWIGERTVSDLD
jgi:hypothetical protein